MPRVVLSMTTIPARNGTLGPTLESIAKQSASFDGLVIYLPPGAEDPRTQLFKWGLKVDIACITCDFDLGPVMKISAALEDLPPDSIIVTIDDDVIYDPRWLATLLNGAEKYPDDAVGFSGWNVYDLINGGDYVWARPGGPADVLEGWSGVAYRRRYLDPSILLVPKEFRNVDDVWISSWLFRRGVMRVSIGEPMCKPTNATKGLHDRADFKELNRRAAQIGFDQ